MTLGNPAVAIQKLQVQRHRLSTALDRFYALDVTNTIALEAAVCDISVPMRVMVHHVPERKSSCLLHQVDPDYWRKQIHFEPVISPGRKEISRGLFSVTVAVPLKLMLEGSKVQFTKYPAGSNPKAKANLNNWWIDTLWHSGTNAISNKTLVLAMANKEGGAHVDADFSAIYRKAKQQGTLQVGDFAVSDIARLGSLVAFAGGELLKYLGEHYSLSSQRTAT